VIFQNSFYTIGMTLPANISLEAPKGLLSAKAQNNILGLFWKLVSCFAFAGVNAVVRYLSGGAGAINQPLPSEVIVCFQNIFGFLILALKEKMGFYRVIGVILGLFGAFIISRPDRAFFQADNNFSWLMMVPLLSALAFACVKILNRKLSLKGESAQLLTTYLLFFMVPASALPALAQWVSPDLVSLKFLMLLGLLGTLAHYSMAKALSYADVTFLTPFGFARIMFTAFLGYILYAELPTNSNLWIGFSIIMLSTICISLGEREINT